jgi:hypothetical protein
MMFGTTPQERDPEGKAGHELRKLFQFVNEQAKLRIFEPANYRSIELTNYRRIS